ncbi:hypothetical protein [Halosolutus halophilus]|uniref:hypothetical protein n=1 Tax=Halosolutus halophilus TaxID=1552990 RepID=UPI0022350950|nr:hypothetical protein [Halosolutus halophilus]
MLRPTGLICTAIERDADGAIATRGVTSLEATTRVPANHELTAAPTGAITIETR